MISDLQVYVKHNLYFLHVYIKNKPLISFFNKNSLLFFGKIWVFTIVVKADIFIYNIFNFYIIAGIISLLEEPMPELKVFALKKLDMIVDEFWPEISEAIEKM